ncbi:MAG TPA: pantoate--beta-alanine ligase [Xanthobacteraceae bacterium]|nr:pantoate--beta-alanine ligase [Xanthobacteraceae bacterium]
MSRAPVIARNLPALRQTLDDYRAKGETLGLVPTMGALHEGHLALVREARRRCQRVAVSIFVNPTQFAPHEDFDAYPRTWDSDVAKLTAEGVDVIWHPDVKTMYPSGFASRIVTEGPAVVDLEDRFRPHFFGGVATVVGKLFIQCRPDVAVFGEKDYQQLRVVTQMARDLDLGVNVVGLETVRETDGLAMSSRNVYLSAEERATAPVLYRTMQETAARLRGGGDLRATLAEGTSRISQAGFAVDYFEARHAETLQPITTFGDQPVRLLVAAKIGTTRLIDNIGA